MEVSGPTAPFTLDWALLFLNPVEAATIDALTGQIIPSEVGSPGAREAGVTEFIDRALAGVLSDLQPVYRNGLVALYEHSTRRFGADFVHLDDRRQRLVIAELDRMGQSEPDEFLGRFFRLVREHTIHGFFGDPAYGGNRDTVGWKLVGFPGAQWSYTAAQMQGISGLGGNINGVLQPGGNPFDPVRARDYPMPPVRAGAGDAPFSEAATRLGLHPFRQPLALNSVDYRGRPACVSCGFCHGYPCHVLAKSTTQVTSIPAARATGNLELRALSRVLRVNRSADGRRVRGVTWIDGIGPEGRSDTA